MARGWEFGFLALYDLENFKKKVKKKKKKQRIYIASVKCLSCFVMHDFLPYPPVLCGFLIAIMF